MFEAVELGSKVSHKEFEAQETELRAALLKAQQELEKREVSLLILLSGVDGSGKPEVVHRLNEWLDPRGLATHTFWETYEEERERPLFWRFWRVLPANGRGAIFFGSWYTEAILHKAYGKINKEELDARLARIAFLERMLVEDGMLIVKFWYHLTQEEQLHKLENAERDKLSRTRVEESDWRHHKMYGRLRKISERAIRETDSDCAPWLLIEAADSRHRDLTTGKMLLEAMRERLAEKEVKATRKSLIPGIKRRTGSVLEKVDLQSKLSEAAYKRNLRILQARLTKLSWEACRKKVSTIVVMEGWDGAGKGSSIRRLTHAMDPRIYRVIPISAPNDEEKAHHYLWRFWRYLPRRGRVTIFDRSWYGRVLVERVEGFATPMEWSRAYLEINEFEEELSESGIILCKFWVHISKEEQARRFKAREETPHKQHKITQEDWRNRKNWDAYEEAINEMVGRTSTEFAPWRLVPGNDKRFARIEVLKTLCSALEKRL